MRNKSVLLMMTMAAALAACSKPDVRSSSGIAARVNGKEITRAQVDKYFTFRTQNADSKLTGVAEQLAKMEILRDLIDREIMSQRAEKLKLTPSAAEIEAQVQQMRGSVPPDEFRKELERRGFSDQDMREEVRQTLAVQKVMQDQVDSKIQITDAEVSSFYQENRDTFNVREPQYHLAQIVVTANPSVPISNLRNDKALNREQAVAKIQRITALAQQGGDFEQLAREYSEDSQTSRAGGDLGYQPISSLEHLGPSLKDAIVKMKVGDVTPVIQTEDAFWILKLLGKREPGQKTLQDPEVNESIHQELRNRKQQLLSSAFSEELHNEAHVENFLAREILSGVPKAK